MQVSTKFEIVFVTAYNSYAVKAFEVAAVDYLLKPIDINRLQEAVEKAHNRITSKAVFQQYEVLQESLQTNKIKNLVIAEKGDQSAVPTDEIIAIEAQQAYSCIYTQQKTFVASKNLKHFQGILADNTNFFRAHKSWIINLDELVKYNKTTKEVQLSNSVTAKLSKHRKDEFEDLLSKN